MLRWHRLILWTDWGRTPRLERADMDGANRRVLVSQNVGWPNGITVDTQTHRVVWVDAKTEVLLSLSVYLSVCLCMTGDVCLCLSVCLSVCVCVCFSHATSSFCLMYQLLNVQCEAPLKLFAIFSLMVNVCSWLLRKHIPHSCHANHNWQWYLCEGDRDREPRWHWPTSTSNKGRPCVRRCSSRGYGVLDRLADTVRVESQCHSHWPCWHWQRWHWQCWHLSVSE